MQIGNEDCFTYLRSNNIEAMQFDGEWVLLDVEEHKAINLNECGGMLWAFLDKPRTFREMLGFMEANYDVASIQAEKDLKTYIQELLEAKVIAIQRKSTS